MSASAEVDRPVSQGERRTVSNATGVTRAKIVDPLAALHEQLEQLFVRARAHCVFAADSSLMLGQPAALDELESLGDELVEAMFSSLPKGVALPERSMVIERDRFVALERWTRAWAERPDSLVLDALVRVALEQRAQFAQVLPRGDRIAFDRALDEVHSALAARSPALAGRWITGVSPSILLIARQVEHLSAGRTPWSPWSVALTMFERGSWPMLMPDGSVLLWLSSEPMLDEPPQSWRERERALLRARDDLSIDAMIAMARCTTLGLGGLTLRDEREAIELEVRRPEMAPERVELGPITRVGRTTGSDLCVKIGLSRSHFTLYYIDERVLLEVDPTATNGLRAGRERLTRGAFTLPQEEPWTVGEIEFRLRRGEGSARAKSALHTGPCATNRSYSDPARKALFTDAGLAMQSNVLVRALSKHPRGAVMIERVEQWTRGPRFSPGPSMNDDSFVARWATERAEQWFAAMHASAPIVRRAPARVHIERSFVSASERVQRAWAQLGEQSAADPLRMRAAFAIDQLPHEDGRGAKVLRNATADTQVRASIAGLDRTQAGAVLLYAMSMQRATPRWAEDVLPFAEQFARIDRDSMLRLARRTLRWDAGGFEASGPNPWATLFDAWMQGALFWHLPDDEVLAFVPYRQPSGALEVNPSGALPPALASGNHVAATLWGVGDVIGPVFKRARATAEQRPRQRPLDAQLVYRDGWLWARDVRWDLLSTTVLGTDGKLVDDELANPRRAFRITPLDGAHWALAPEGGSARENLKINGRITRARPLVDGDLVELERDGAVIFSGAYECPSQRA